MAALGKIRKRGLILISIIGLGLFAFIAEEGFRSCEASRNDRRQQIGEVLGEKVSVQDFQKLIDEYSEVIKMQQGVNNLNEMQLNQVKDMVWQTYIQTKVVENEANKLGLTVTDAELQNILNEGTNPMLMQTPFVNQQTGRFDANSLKKFLADYKTQQTANPQLAEQYQALYKYWTFIEKTLRQQLLAQKYQSLLASCILSNPVEAKMAYKETNEESQIELATFPYSSIEDSKVKISDADLKAKYEEVKGRFKQYVESRDIKYVTVQVAPSANDRAALQKSFTKYTADLAAAADPANAVRKSTSLVNYLGLPVAKTAYASDIADRLDSMAVGQTFGPFESQMDNTLNVIKLVSKQLLPDSVQYRQIQVMGATADEAQKRADSIYTALNGGADFELLAIKYGQTGEKTWLTTAQYQQAPSMDADTKTYINTLNNLGVSETRNMKLGQGNIIIQVVDRRAMINKYTAAVIKKTIDFSKETYSTAYNKFSSFVSANQTPDKIAKNAKGCGYTVQEAKDITTSTHTLVGINDTRDALKWLFEAKEGEISPMYECGNNDQLLLVVLDKIHPKGYRPYDDPQVKEMLKAEVMRDKKAEQLMAKAKDVKSVSAAKAKGATVAPVNQVTFSAPVFVMSTGASEPALSGAVAATAKGQFSAKPVKGNAGVYVFQVTNRTTRPGKFEAKAEEDKARQKALQFAGNFMNELVIKAGVVDDRYLFF
ncbi:SurA N-terminal domain-containing protein [Hoylesella buccalis]|uniref:peptidylprolyl isomerase n=1 Tax=Hoylesella buccalis TaxID=28127 RepID=UPI001D14FEE9|nr:peptidylprolyl isomerase [Hoylesella buccalis]UEA62239.1 SurA N-terminal domain-containing protein [Hoylesella buccalis]UWP50479.1 SurA N-terminal domain-containing protein [Hoylesella buccalis ATCC 35310]